MFVHAKFKVVTSLLSLLFISACQPTPTLDMKKENGSYYLTSNTGLQLRITAYGEAILRLQTVRSGETFYPDDHYEMIEHHNWNRKVQVTETKSNMLFETSSLKLAINKDTFTASFYLPQSNEPVLQESTPLQWQGNNITTSFTPDSKEHFTGLGHGYYARAESIDLKGQVVRRNYGSVPIEQAPLLVPFYISSKGYGVFLNSTFSNTFSFTDEEYSISIDDAGFSGRMDYVFIAGGKVGEVLKNYVELTGKPRLPQKAMFGLQLSDKGHDHNSSTPSDENWWKQKITEHRVAGFPLDHVVNDNRWRADGGQRCISKIAWDKERYPNPAEYQKWLEQQGLVITLDFNRCIARFSEGYKPEFNIPNIKNIEFPESAPDLTNAEFRDWFWQVFEQHGLKPQQNYPGDALWIDEFDEQGAAPKELVLANGLSSAEMRNYWFFLIAKALVEQGWDKSEINKRPFVWVRGMTSGAQRYATLWSGDIYPNYKDMRGQIRGMQLAGLSGFPYWGHDAGGFFDWNTGLGPDENLYQRWAMAFGSFAPIWKPHGMGQSRWPLDREKSVQQTAHYFSKLRYTLMPYTYSMAHQASSSGTPITRAMIFDYQTQPNAWKYDLQYMWGDSILVAPQTKDKGQMQVWLPKLNADTWYEYTSKQPVKSGQVLTLEPAINELPLYVKAGAIIAKRDYALSTAFIDKTKLTLDIYVGEHGVFELIEDDDKTERHRLNGEKRSTLIIWNQATKTLDVKAAIGNYSGAENAREITVNFYGLSSALKAKVNGQIKVLNKVDRGLQLSVEQSDVSQAVKIQLFEKQ